MKRKIIIGLGLFHLLFIFLSNVFSGYAEYCDYYNKPINNVMSQCAVACFENKPISYYAVYTGTSTGYGFFAPNVRSPIKLSCMYQNNEVVPTFHSNEGKLRYNNLIGSLVENISAAKDTIQAAEKKAFDIKRRYNELVFKSIAVKLWNDCKLPPSDLSMCLSFVKHTPLKEARKGKTYDNVLLPLQHLNLTINNEKGNQ